MLVTRLPFGMWSQLSSIHCDAFIRRLFPDFILGVHRDQHLRLRVSSVLNLYENTSGLFDEDVVHICSIVIVETVLLDCQPHQYVSNIVVRVVDDTDIWNDYPWGSLISLKLFIF